MTEPEERDKYFQEVKAAYPGIHCFVSMRRDQKGNTLIALFDLQVNPAEPIYHIAIHPRDMLILNDGFTTPAMTWAEFLDALNGVTPPGFKPADY